jgi:hypothetical protein
MSIRAFVAFAPALVLVGCGARTDLGAAGGAGGVGGAAATPASSEVSTGPGFGGSTTIGSTGGASPTATIAATSATGVSASSSASSSVASSTAASTAVSSSSSGCPNCPCPSAVFGGRTFLFCQDMRTWPEAEMFCAGLGGHLASIHSTAENDFIFQEINAFSHDKAWIGFNDRAVEGTFVWTDASPSDFTDWAPGEPNNAGGNEDCGQLDRFYPDETWNDEPCDEALRFVCEI